MQQERAWVKRAKPPHLSLRHLLWCSERTLQTEVQDALTRWGSMEVPPSRACLPFYPSALSSQDPSLFSAAWGVSMFSLPPSFCFP